MHDFTDFHCPRWKELPDIPLYLDQLLMVVQGAVGELSAEGTLTKSMINNYVKQKIVEAPGGKKYERSHIATLIVITLLKRVFSMTEIGKLIEYMVDGYGIEVAYDMFCERLEKMLRKAFGEESYTVDVAAHQRGMTAMLDVTLLALVSKLRVQGFLEDIFPAEEPEEKEGRSKKAAAQ